MFNFDQYFTLLGIGGVWVYQKPGDLVHIYLQSYSSYSTALWRKCMDIFKKFHSTICPNLSWYHSIIQRIVKVCHCSHFWPLRLPYNLSRSIKTDKDITSDQHLVDAVSSSVHPFMLVDGWMSPTYWLTETKFPSTPPPMITVPTLSISLSSLLWMRVVTSIFVLLR